MTMDHGDRAAGWPFAVVAACVVACTQVSTPDGGAHARDVPTADTASVDDVHDVASDGGAEALDVTSEPTADAAPIDVVRDIPGDIRDASPSDAPCVLPDGRVPDLQTDIWNCGGCGVVCCRGFLCSSGVCGYDCPGTGDACPLPSEADAGCAATVGCIYVQSDPANCGSCGHACGAGQVCVSGVCV